MLLMQFTRMRILPHCIIEFKREMDNIIEFAKANSPHIVLQIHIDEDEMYGYSCHVYPDSDSMESYWQASSPHVGGLNDVSKVESTDIFGQISPSVWRKLDQFSKAGIKVNVVPGYLGFDRLHQY